MSSRDRQGDEVDLFVYRLPSETEWPLRPAGLRRTWMDQFKDSWPYRCLPLNIANQAGWELLCPVSFEVVWDGGQGLEAMRLDLDEPDARYSSLIRSHFGGGIVTFCPPLLFRTQRPIGLFVRGPCNFWIDGAAALDGWVESWGLEATFTMNWKITRPNEPVRFEKDEPICLIQPFEVDLLERTRPVIRNLVDNPDLAERHERWTSRRYMFSRLREHDRSQHTYTRGLDEAGAAVPGHRTRLDLHDPSVESSVD